MKSFRYMLAGATALGLVMAASAAFAGDSNSLYVKQDGAGNITSVEQSFGSGGNDIGTQASPFLQKGDNNKLSETQATGGGFSRGNNDIVKGQQTGDNNVFNDGYSNNAGDNVISNFAQVGDNNWASVGRNASISGTITTLSENGDHNALSISQVGTSNTVTKATITGNNNGAFGPSGPQNASNWGMLISQSGSNNLITESSIDGSNNNTGSNVVSPGRPVVYISQDGSHNGQTASLARLKGRNGNGISVTETGDYNNFSVQSGLSDLSIGNFTTVTQTGSFNSATATQFGQGNSLVVNQLADSNTSSTLFTGDNNGVGSFTAGNAADSLRSHNALQLTQGTVLQDSTGSVIGGNSLSYTVHGSSNLFAFAQIGGNNTITGTVGSDSNQAAVLQVGNTNTASFTQTAGGGNVVAVHQ